MNNKNNKPKNLKKLNNNTIPDKICQQIKSGITNIKNGSFKPVAVDMNKINKILKETD